MNRIVWLVSYPKSGNTWMRFLIESALRGGAAVDINRPEMMTFTPFSRAQLDEVLGVNTSDLTEVECNEFRGEAYRMIAAGSAEPIVSKVHERWAKSVSGRAIFPPAAGNKGVYLVRDPRDVACSLAHHLSISIDDAITYMGNPEAALAASKVGNNGQIIQRLGIWGEHVAGWLDQSEIAIHTIRYEDLLSDTHGVLVAMFAFLDIEVGEEAVHGACQATRFETMQQAELNLGFRERPSSSPQFFRSGRAQRWREQLTPIQIARIEGDHTAAMARLGYEPA